MRNPDYVYERLKTDAEVLPPTRPDAYLGLGLSGNQIAELNGGLLKNLGDHLSSTPQPNKLLSDDPNLAGQIDVNGRPISFAAINQEGAAGSIGCAYGGFASLDNTN